MAVAQRERRGDERSQKYVLLLKRSAFRSALLTCSSAVANCKKRRGSEGHQGWMRDGTPLPAQGFRGSRAPKNVYISYAKFCILVHSWLRKWASATPKSLASKQAVGRRLDLEALLVHKRKRIPPNLLIYFYWFNRSVIWWLAGAIFQ